MKKDRNTMLAAFPSTSAPRTYALHKPRGVLSIANTPSAKCQGRTLTDLMLAAGVAPLRGHIGRLDIQTSGLLLVTEDATLMRALTDEAASLPKTYSLLLAGRHPETSPVLTSLRAPLSASSLRT